MKTIKSIDGKSLLIGGLLACVIFLAMGATGPKEEWDNKQEWVVGEVHDTFEGTTAQYLAMTDAERKKAKKVYQLNYFGKDWSEDVFKWNGKLEHQHQQHKVWPLGWEPIGTYYHPERDQWKTIVRKRLR